ncbi:MAG: hypothetical protein ACLUGJ_13055 [Blautia wexlerae]
MNKGIIYCTKIREEYEGAHMEHMIAEKLLEIALKKEYGINLYNEPRAEGEHGKPFLSYRPIHCIIISVIPENMWYVFWLIRRLELMCRFIAEPIMKECSERMVTPGNSI